MSDRVLTLSSLIVACAVVIGLGIELGSWMLDDAFIFFRYAENWAAGHGPVFNVGEPPVEGFTSFSWLAILTAARLCGADLMTAAVVLGYLLVFATLVVVNQSWRWLDEVDARIAAFATLFLGTCGAFATWTRGGMETALQAFLVTSLLIVYLRAKEREHVPMRFVAIGILCTLIGMTRPDGLVVVAVLAVDAFLSRSSVRRSGFVTTATVFLVGFGVYYAIRWWYFGYPFPNTFYAKVGATSTQVQRGLGYVGQATVFVAPLIVLLLAAGTGWRPVRRRVNRRYVVLPALLVVYTVYIVSVGGDIMPAFRFFTPILPALCLLAAMALRALPAPVHWPGVVVTVAFGLFMIYARITPLIRGDVVAHNGRIAGLWLRDHAPAGSVIATNTAGTVVYYSGLPAIDMLGLNDLHIAHVQVSDMGSGHAGHEKGDGDYVLRRRPEFIQLGSSLGWVPTKGNELPPFPGGKQLWQNPEFRSGYKLLYMEGDTLWPGGNRCGYFGFYVRNDIFAKLDKDK